MLQRGYFSDPVYVQTYEQQISFFHHMPGSITPSVSLVHILKYFLYFTFSSIKEKYILSQKFSW